MLTELSVTNFKSWQRIKQMRLGPITGLFGPNSSGKTSVLQLLLMLKQTVESPDRAQALMLGSEKSPADLGSFSDVVFGHGERLSWRLAWEYGEPFAVTDPDDVLKELFSCRRMAFEAEVSEGRMQRPVVDRMTYELQDKRGGIRFALRRRGKSESKYELDTEGLAFRFQRNRGRPADLPRPVKCYGFPDQVRTRYQNAGFLADLELAFEELLGRVYYLGPLRDYPRRQYQWAGAEPADMGQRGEHVVHALLAARERDLRIWPGPFKKKVLLEEYEAQWLQKLGLVETFTVERISRDSNLYRVRVRKSANSSDVLITDVGFGVSQILPVLVLCYYVPEGSTVLLEQPEIHLHPSVQAGLADVFIDAVERRGVQIIFESHSEHLLRRLQRRMAEEKITPESTALYFCEMRNGESRLRSLELDPYGRIANWPEGFFGDEFGEMAATTTAAMKRIAEGR